MTFRSDDDSFRSALCGDREVLFVATDMHLLFSAIAERGLMISCMGDVAAWFKETGEILPGVEMKEADK